MNKEIKKYNSDVISGEYGYAIDTPEYNTDLEEMYLYTTFITISNLWLLNQFHLCTTVQLR